MNKTKRVMAIVGIAVLVILYLITFFLAIFGNDNTNKLFTASIVATIVVPVLMYIYQWIYKLLKKDVKDAAEKQAAKNAENKEN